MGRKSMSVIVLAALALGAGTVPGAASGSACAGDEYVEGFDLEADPRQDRYAIGETARIDVHVTDRLTGAPVARVDAGIFVDGKRDKVLLDNGETDDAGHVLLELRLTRAKVKPGAARALVGAWDPVNTPVYCTGRYGYRRYPRLFRITR